MKCKQSPDIFISACEPSGDLHGSELIDMLLEDNPHLKISSIAGPKMRQKNTYCLFPMEKLAVMGFFDILYFLPKILLYFFRIRRFILKKKPKVCVFIDYPEFHLQLQKSLRKKGFKGKLIQYVCPSVWAWRKKRIQTMEKNLDHLLTIFPFEKRYFASTKLSVNYVGHPIIHSKTSKKIVKKDTQKSLFVGIFPGSRKKEIERNLPLQWQTLSKFKENVEFAVSIANQDSEKVIDRIIKEQGCKVRKIYPKEISSFMNSIDLAVATSGTVTLELALYRVPTIVTFAVPLLDLLLIQKILKIDLPFYCIVNILSKRAVFPELFGPNFTRSKLLYYFEEYLHSEEKRKLCREECALIEKSLHKKKNDPSKANVIFSYLNRLNAK